MRMRVPFGETMCDRICWHFECLSGGAPSPRPCLHMRRVIREVNVFDRDIAIKIGRRVMSILLLCAVTGSIAHARTDALKLVEQTIEVAGERQTVRVPEGYRLELLTDKLDGPRLLTFAPNGELLLGSKSGSDYRLSPPYTRPGVLVTLEDYPLSVALRGDEMLIAETNGLYRTFYRPGQARILPQDVKLLAPLPSGGTHSSRSVAIGPDGRVYLSLGIGGNCSDQYIGDNYPADARRCADNPLASPTPRAAYTAARADRLCRTASRSAARGSAQRRADAGRRA